MLLISQLWYQVPKERLHDSCQNPGSSHHWCRGWCVTAGSLQTSSPLPRSTDIFTVFISALQPVRMSYTCCALQWRPLSPVNSLWQPNYTLIGAVTSLHGNNTEKLLFLANQWSFRGGTRGNAVPIVKISLERMGTTFPLLTTTEWLVM